MMEHRKVSNPLLMLADQQTLGQKDADAHILPMLVHLEEVRQGHGHVDSIRIITVYLQAMMSCVNNTDTRSNDSLIRVMCEAGKAWMSAGNRCNDKGIFNRIVLSVDEWSAVSKAVRYFMQVMPKVKLYIWRGAFNHGVKLWDDYAKSDDCVYN